MSKTYYVYILSIKTKVLYIGVTDHLIKRVYQHKNNLVEGFTQRYNIHKLVYFETHFSIIEAIRKEKLLKRWKRQCPEGIPLGEDRVN